MCNPSHNHDLQPGDIAAAIRELTTLSKFCRSAARDYLNHPAADELERGINHTRSATAEARAAAFDRINLHLAGELIKRQKPQENSHAG